ncbi:hypothetical protein SAMN05421810_113112 [Amycolatopsis arida]|uniref:Uncharacterized protein n=1 Tax=Amycolatopsis arida TaxID=587909 RepID=A0A1I6ANA5_9PSEU|nr:hypothetical protein CLV69_113112 [Amycolatopsis arida]SFQ70132.1 hypothetical protein SAMN05421810_113112 [Amycolatopsis arida]
MTTPTPPRVERLAWAATLTVLPLALAFMVALWNRPPAGRSRPIPARGAP